MMMTEEQNAELSKIYDSIPEYEPTNEELQKMCVFFGYEFEKISKTPLRTFVFPCDNAIVKIESDPVCLVQGQDKQDEESKIKEIS